jgi:hypothetical protein
MKCIHSKLQDDYFIYTQKYKKTDWEGLFIYDKP